MPGYVDGFVIPLPKKNVAAYRKIARVAAKVWLDHGALEYREAVGEDLSSPAASFLGASRAKKGETVVFAWIVYKSRAHRDRVNAKVMKDPRVLSAPDPMPFDVKRMVYGGFDILVSGGR
jgi:uncharacterized protein YbaA (DUF1428 family)